MFQEILRISAILPPFFDPKDGMKIWNLVKISQVRKSYRKHRFSYDFLIVM